MTRRLANWLESYVEYSSVMEAPRIMHAWAGVAAISGALRRKVWFDQIRFKLFPSFYIIFVGPPGIVTKSMTAGGAIDLLKRVPGIHFGPDQITSQQLVTSFADSAQSFEYPEGTWTTMSPVTYFASELGSLLDFDDAGMVNLLIDLWDGRSTYAKETKTQGKDMVEGPWISLLACTTPQWINSNMNENTIGGGFTSRCIFVYGDKKEKLVAWIENMIGDEAKYEKLQFDLVHDLEHMAVNLKGRYRLTPAAMAWGEKWYAQLWEKEYSLDNPDYINNYLSRKQAHLIKLSIILAASKSDELLIDLEDMRLAEMMLNTTESNFRRVFSKVGRSDEAQHADVLRSAVEAKKEMPYSDLVRLSQAHFPNSRDLEGILKSFIQGKQMELVVGTGGTWVKWVG